METSRMELLPVRIGRKLVLIKIDQIDSIEADRNYVLIHVKERTYVLRQTLSRIEKKLNFTRLIRVSRSVIVNIDRIRELRSGGHSTCEVVLDGDRVWSMGRKFRRNLDKFMVSWRPGSELNDR